MVMEINVEGSEDEYSQRKGWGGSEASQSLEIGEMTKGVA